MAAFFLLSARARYAIDLLPFGVGPTLPQASLRIGVFAKGATSARLGVNPRLVLAPVLQPRQHSAPLRPAAPRAVGVTATPPVTSSKPRSCAGYPGYASEMIKRESDASRSYDGRVNAATLSPAPPSQCVGHASINSRRRASASERRVGPVADDAVWSLSLEPNNLGPKRGKVSEGGTTGRRGVALGRTGVRAKAAGRRWSRSSFFHRPQYILQALVPVLVKPDRIDVAQRLVVAD
jgi:hypothetical protein